MTETPLSGAISTAKAFLNAWKRRDWPGMLSLTTETWKAKYSPEDGEAQIRAWFEAYRLVHFEIKPEPKEATSEMAFKLRLNTKINRVMAATTVKREPPVECMAVRELAPYEPSTEGRWGINPVSVWHRDQPTQAQPQTMSSR